MKWMTGFAKSLQPFSQNYALASHTIYVVCVNFMHEWRNLKFEVDFKRQSFGQNFQCNFIYS